MTGPSKAMKAAFPPKLSEGAERLRYTLHYRHLTAEALARSIVAQLGITPAMVEDVKPMLQPSSGHPHAINQAAAADALATLLEVAGRSQANPDSVESEK